MKAVADPNWLTIVGLLYTFFGLGQLAGISTVRSAATNAQANSEERAARRSVRAAFTVLLLAIGFAHLLLANFFTLPFGAYAVFASLTLVMTGIVFALVGDLWAASIATPSCIGTQPEQSRIGSLVANGRDESAPEGRRRVDLVHAAG